MPEGNENVSGSLWFCCFVGRKFFKPAVNDCCCFKAPVLFVYVYLRHYPKKSQKRLFLPKIIKIAIINSKTNFLKSLELAMGRKSEYHLKRS